jgi:hypothetical protein
MHGVPSRIISRAEGVTLHFKKVQINMWKQLGHIMCRGFEHVPLLHGHQQMMSGRCLHVLFDECKGMLGATMVDI